MPPLIVLLSPDTYLYLMLALLVVSTVSLLRWWFRSRRRRRWLRLVATVVLAAGWYVFLRGAFVDFARVEVRRVELTFADLPPAFDGYRIALFSDAHVGSYQGWRESILRRAVDSINAQRADAIVFAGDLQNVYPKEILPHQQLLSSLRATDGVSPCLETTTMPNIPAPTS